MDDKPMSRTAWLKTQAARDLAAYIREGCRGTQYKYTAAASMRHAECITEINASNIYTCHTHKVQGIS